jgi:hypothetical protein
MYVPEAGISHHRADDGSSREERHFSSTLLPEAFNWF